MGFFKQVIDFGTKTATIRAHSLLPSCRRSGRFRSPESSATTWTTSTSCSTTYSSPSRRSPTAPSPAKDPPSPPSTLKNGGKMEMMTKQDLQLKMTKTKINNRRRFTRTSLTFWILLNSRLDERNIFRMRCQNKSRETITTIFIAAMKLTEKSIIYYLKIV
jgi:hypothetical protein